mgnify:CR=1 FL=1
MILRKLVIKKKPDIFSQDWTFTGEFMGLHFWISWTKIEPTVEIKCEISAYMDIICTDSIN